ncbi:NAD(P)/FAD-dependent oxidoreductase [Williamsia serinedens]|uniref:Thioredoxin reductase n=1 Tax=Williamsia serinedens TaxID=391736 RepID=A0ABT1GWV6_9NOCA|nr:NAD(P)/FAD-dependent oxidoreductase [Williamsia serinedens]MCP2159446.1 Thioredoxin reductase [Williamsia serinedens]
MDTDTVDVVVIGGGAAGLNGALMLARSRRSVVVVDAGDPRNAPADGVHGLFAREGVAPGDLLAQGRREVTGYGGRVVDGRVAELSGDVTSGFRARLDDGSTIGARRVLVATGLTDVLPPIPGMTELWGIDVLHCPYCHGWEVRDRAIGIVASGPASLHHALLFRQLSDDVVYFAQGTVLDAEAREKLAARDIRVLDGAVVALEVADGRLAGVRLDDGIVVARDAVAVAPRMEARVAVAAGVGLVATDHPMGVGTHVAASPTGLTDVPGVWVAGNAGDLMAQVGASAAQGAMAGAHINADLVAEDTARAVAARREAVVS